MPTESLLLGLAGRHTKGLSESVLVGQKLS